MSDVNDKIAFQESQRRYFERKEMIESLTGKERRFYDKIEKVKTLNISRYVMSMWQSILLNKLSHGIYLNGDYDAFCYGFYQGMQYMKNQQKKNVKKC